MTRTETIIRNAFKLPNLAKDVECMIAERMLRYHGTNAGKTPLGKQSIGGNENRKIRSERRKEIILGNCGRDWQRISDVVRGVGKESASRSATYAMIRDGRLESRKVRNRVEVRLPHDRICKSK